ncbi:hypothetical protein CEG14_14405 [Bordetella genomosp. 1]|uniref:Uncharacterized protein n=1 Tax=Bordetella genomosp. 1 TaxID=1395607 RepID=A0A261SGZ4_9BORD|nr:hypothetical protein [Bordetella genomosp. 1]OZI36212.1 hypothetical protein CEG14_14405 [Bordetella genomosp. 1]
MTTPLALNTPLPAQALDRGAIDLATPAFKLAVLLERYQMLHDEVMQQAEKVQALNTQLRTLGQEKSLLLEAGVAGQPATAQREAIDKEIARVAGQQSREASRLEDMTQHLTLALEALKADASLLSNASRDALGKLP